MLVLASVWILLAATRITRGEEDAGRCDLLLAGRLRMVDVVAALPGGTSPDRARGDQRGRRSQASWRPVPTPTGAVVYAAAILGVTLTFATAGVLAAQIMPTRSAAVGVTVGVLGVGLLLRMLADGAPALAWSAWTTPFGLTARAAPYADNRVAPLLVLAAFPIALAAAALVMRAAPRRGQRLGAGRDEPSTADPAAGVGRRIRGASCASGRRSAGRSASPPTSSSSAH